jgi:anti-sigma B factor antagonist
MKYSIDKQGDLAILTLEEENLNSALAPQLKSDLIMLSNDNLDYLVLDLSNVKYSDSSGLSAILTGHRIWKGRGGFVLAGSLSPSVRKLIEISRLDSILEIQGSVAEAIQHVRNQPAA